jgi:hypothetical protein
MSRPGGRPFASTRARTLGSLSRSMLQELSDLMPAVYADHKAVEATVALHLAHAYRQGMEDAAEIMRSYGVVAHSLAQILDREAGGEGKL